MTPMLPAALALMLVTFDVDTVAPGASAPTAADRATADADEIAAARTGDIVLHTSKTPQAVAVAWATKSIYTHVGVVVVEGGVPYVYEAVSTVRKTPLDRWIARGRAGTHLALRHPDVDDAAQRRVAAAAKKHLGKRYDLAFAPGDERLYCSEYVRAVLGAAGVDVGAVERVKDLDVDNPIVRALVDKRWKKHPLCRGAASVEACWPRLLEMPIVTPASLARDERLVAVDG